MVPLVLTDIQDSLPCQWECRVNHHHHTSSIIPIHQVSRNTSSIRPILCLLVARIPMEDRPTKWQAGNRHSRDSIRHNQVLSMGTHHLELPVETVHNNSSIIHKEHPVEGHHPKATTTPTIVVVRLLMVSFNQACHQE